MLSDVEIAQQSKPKHIRDIAGELGITEDDLIYYGRDKAKIPSRYLSGSKIALMGS
jgi:formate--tetrahydrofolate ligase